jgi:hypothetical protein
MPTSISSVEERLRHGLCWGRFLFGGSAMGELLDKLNALDDLEPAVEPVSPFDQAMQAFRSASQRVNEAIEIVQEPGMPVDRIRRWTRQEPLRR